MFTDLDEDNELEASPDCRGEHFGVSVGQFVEESVEQSVSDSGEIPHRCRSPRDSSVFYAFRPKHAALMFYPFNPSAKENDLQQFPENSQFN